MAAANVTIEQLDELNEDLKEENLRCVKLLTALLSQFSSEESTNRDFRMLKSISDVSTKPVAENDA